MDIGNWGSSRGRSVRSGRGYHELESMGSMSIHGASNKPKWKELWRKFKNERRKMLESMSSASRVHGGAPYYDEYTYNQNFDQGLVWNEPDSLSRSFSVRYARSSRALLAKTM